MPLVMREGSSRSPRAGALCRRPPTLGIEERQAALPLHAVLGEAAADAASTDSPSLCSAGSSLILSSSPSPDAAAQRGGRAHLGALAAEQEDEEQGCGANQEAEPFLGRDSPPRSPRQRRRAEAEHDGAFEASPSAVAHGAW